jgi:TonB-linked SusC/RagA family outer membrane protein
MKRLLKSTKMKGAIFALLLAFSLSVSAQTQVRGTVIDEYGDPAIGATIQVKGTTQGTVTDIDGNFTISAPAGGTLVISYVGYATQEVPVSANVRVMLTTDDELLDELIVTAYGVTTRRAFTGAAGVVSSRDIERLQVSNLSRALEGAVPGLQVAAHGGQPGSEGTMRIRGYGSLAGGNNPLIVLDGAVFHGSLNSINTQDIESISVLRDAASAALYGSRAANGVIIVTTRRGQVGTPRVNIDVRQGINIRAQSLYETLSDPGEYLQMYWSGLRREAMTQAAHAANPGQRASDILFSGTGRGLRGYNPFLGVASNQVVDANGNLNRGTGLRWNDSWQDELYRVGHRSEINLSISSGTDKSTSFFSVGFLDDQGIVTNTGFTRFSARLNSTYDITQNFKVGGGLAYSRTDQNQIRAADGNTAFSNSFFFVNSIAPIYPVFMYDANGGLMTGPNGNALFDWGNARMPGVSGRGFGANTNPVAGNIDDKNQILIDNISARGNAEYSFLNGFRVSANLGYDAINEATNVFFNPVNGDAAGIRGRVQKTIRRIETMTFNQLLHYNRTFDGVHNVSALAGHESYSFRRTRLYAEKTGLHLDDVIEFDNATTMSAMDSNTWGKSLESYLGQLLYDYSGKYYFSASFRRDGSSVFHPDNRWGNFWSVGGSWRISEEAFMDNVHIVNNLRLRASYGTSGNDVILNNGGTQIYVPFEDQYTLDSSGGLTLVYKGNRDLRWEKNNNFNVGFDIGMLNNRLRFELDYYIRNSHDLLYNRPYPSSMGFSFIPENIGSMRNSGIEFTLSGDVISTRDFGWTVTFLGGFNKNKITELPTDPIISGSRIRRVGGTIHDFYLEEFAGVDPDNGNSLWWGINPTTGEREITANYAWAPGARTVAGSALPDFTGAINMNLRYKNFDFAVTSNFQIGGYLYDGVYAGTVHGGSSFNNWHIDMRNAWTEENRFTDIPRIDAAYQNANARSDRFLIGADFFSLRSMTLGYTLPKNMLANAGLSSMRFYVTGDNIALFSRRKGLDPRQSLSSGIAGTQNVMGGSEFGYTPVGSYSLGITLGF